ncbi:MAG: hypothetical protein J6A15_02465 [Clostridia bacterium]|nr:hypothetical protein [Clostridia bacterium]
MKNKVVTIVCVILIILAVACFGYIFLNSDDEVETPSQGEQQEQQPQEEQEEVVGREEKGQNIIVTSRIGVQLREVIRLSNMYSNVITDEMDQNGLSNKAKILVGLDKIFRTQEYASYAEYSDEYSNTYITAENMHKVIADTFADSQVTDEGIEDTLPYDEETNSYIVPSIGYAGGTFSYTIEVPYKITQYSDRVELLAYRVYITKTVEMESTTTNIKNELFYDKAKSLPALTITDTSLDNEANQTNYVKTKIDDKTIDSTSLESVQYTFKLVDEEYKIAEFKEI